MLLGLIPVEGKEGGRLRQNKKWSFGEGPRQPLLRQVQPSELSPVRRDGQVFLLCVDQERGLVASTLTSCHLYSHPSNYIVLGPSVFQDW